MTSKLAKMYYSQSYMWSSDDYLARGATGEVYKGYHRRSGDKVAVKMFTRQSEYGAMTREMEAIKQIPKHDNIVQFLEINEKERNEGHYFIVMELCNAGSLYEVIDSPENAFGLDEEQFKLVVLHVSRGLCHLKKNKFAHRDIKPGNILRVKDVDGRYTFKLTDFGTARKLAPDEPFTSLHGTEEYLYPAMYERALINPRVKAQFSDKVDLWSVGATFFHVATGRLPFQPFHKRDDRNTMFQILENKRTKVILGWQEGPGKKIFYSEHLPPDARISDGLKGIITPVLRGLLENDFGKMWDFDYFFQYIERINLLKAVDVFCVSTCVLIKVYLDTSNPDILKQFKEAIHTQTGLSAKHMELYHDNIQLRTIRPGQSFHIPNTTPDSPVTVFGGPPKKSTELETPPLQRAPRYIKDNQRTSLTDELRYAKDCAKVAWTYVHSSEYIARTYRLMIQAANCLSQMVYQEYLNLREKKEKVEEMYDFALRQLDDHAKSLEYEANILQTIGSGNSQEMDSEIRRIAGLLDQKRNEYLDIENERRSNLNFESFFSQIESLLDNGNLSAEMETRKFDDGVKKIHNYVSEVEDIFKAFQNEKKYKQHQQDNTFNRQVNEIRIFDINQRMQKAVVELESMVQKRAEVYQTLYGLLAKCVGLREDLNKGEHALSYSISTLQPKIKSLEKWLPDHYRYMQSVYQRIAGSRAGEATDSGVSFGQQQPSSSSSFVPKEIVTLLINLSSLTKTSNSLVEEQKKYLDRVSK